MGGIHILIPAAGAARRMRGIDKLLEPVGGVSLLRRAVDAARAARPVKLWVTLPPDAEARRAALAGSHAKPIEVPDWQEGLAASLRAGVRAAAAQNATGLLVLLADLPEIETADIARFFEAHAKAPEAVLRGTSQSGAPGHPVLIPARLFAQVAALTGDAGAKALLDGETVRDLKLPGDRAVTDLDTPEDWAAWRARTGL